MSRKVGARGNPPRVTSPNPNPNRPSVDCIYYAPSRNGNYCIIPLRWCYTGQFLTTILMETRRLLGLLISEAMQAKAMSVVRTGSCKGFHRETYWRTWHLDVLQFHPLLAVHPENVCSMKKSDPVFKSSQPKWRPVPADQRDAKTLKLANLNKLDDWATE